MNIVPFMKLNINLMVHSEYCRLMRVFWLCPLARHLIFDLIFFKSFFTCQECSTVLIEVLLLYKPFCNLSRVHAHKSCSTYSLLHSSYSSFRSEIFNWVCRCASKTSDNEWMTDVFAKWILNVCLQHVAWLQLKLYLN